MTRIKSTQHLPTSGSKLQLLMIVVVIMAAPRLILTRKTRHHYSRPHLKNASFDALPFVDVIFKEDLLLNVRARSRIECSKKCVETKQCAMGTFHSSPEGRPRLPGLCRLHGRLKGSGDVTESSPGARSMALRRRRCADGYKRVSNRCLRAVEKSANYDTARKECQRRNSSLVQISSSTELKSIWDFARKHGLTRFWLGADNQENSSVFRWNDGTLLNEDSPLWASGEPDIPAEFDKCVNMKLNEPRLRDSPCSDTRNYICDAPL